MESTMLRPHSLRHLGDVSAQKSTGGSFNVPNQQPVAGTKYLYGGARGRCGRQAQTHHFKAYKNGNMHRISFVAREPLPAPS